MIQETTMDDPMATVAPHSKTREDLWLAWAEHRRSRVLASQFGARLVEMDLRAPRLIRYGVLTERTVRLLLRTRPRVVYCQNPSIVLAALVCALRRLLGYFAVVDRHSNFKLESRDARSLKWRLFHWVSDYSVANADVTIVTNDDLAGFVQSIGGTPCVLHDKLPAMPDAIEDTRDKRLVVFVCSFSWDEPVDEVIKAAGNLDPTIRIAITGRVPPEYEAVREAHQQREGGASVEFTGFLSETDYDQLIATADSVVVLTTNEHTLVCGAYEALAAGRPLVLSDTRALRDFFGQAAIIVSNDSKSIAAGISEALDRSDELRSRSLARGRELELLWEERFHDVVDTMKQGGIESYPMIETI